VISPDQVGIASGWVSGDLELESEAVAALRE